MRPLIIGALVFITVCGALVSALHSRNAQRAYRRTMGGPGPCMAVAMGSKPPVRAVTLFGPGSITTEDTLHELVARGNAGSGVVLCALRAGHRGDHLVRPIDVALGGYMLPPF